MRKVYGLGDYERSDVDLKLSVLEMRVEFLRALIEKKGNWRVELFQIINAKVIPEKEIEKISQENHCDIQQTLFNFSSPFLFTHNPYNIEFVPELFNTVLLNFFRFIDSNKKKIEELAKTAEAELQIPNDFEIRRNALRLFLPNWETLTKLPDSKVVCESLEKYAKNYNLNEIWILDYFVLVLAEFKARLEYTKRDSENSSSYFNIFIYVDAVQDTLLRGLSKYEDEKLSKNFETDTKDWEVKPFLFKHQGNILIETTWFPQFMTRRNFVKVTTNEFYRRFELLKVFNIKYQNFDERVINIELERHCDRVESLNLQTFFYSEYYFGLLSVSEPWNQKIESREEFIKMSIEELRGSFSNVKDIAQSSGTFKKETFELNLFSYCNEIEKNKPANYSKTPKKYTGDVHFEWLVSYQVTPYKDYPEIAQETGNTVNAVKRGIKRIAKMLKIELRTPTRKGRPKGIAETHKRNRISSYKENRKRNILNLKLP